MEIRNEVANGTAVYRIAGRIDALASPNLETAVRSTIGSGAPWIIYDLRDVPYLSSAGLRGILLVAKQATAAGGGLAVFGLQSAVDEVFEASGFHSIIMVAPDEAQARSKLGR